MQSLKGLKDIKSIVQIPDFSFYIFLSLIIVGVIVVIILSIYIFKFIKKRDQSKRKFYIQKLKNIDLNDSKKAAYLITKYARILANTKESEKILEELLKELDKYKYVKNSPKMDEQSKKYLKLFLEVCCE